MRIIRLINNSFFRAFSGGVVLGAIMFYISNPSKFMLVWGGCWAILFALSFAPFRKDTSREEVESWED